MNIFLASSLRALWGKGAISKHFITSNILYKGHCLEFQFCFKVLTHFSPFSLMFGWNIFVIKKHLGAPMGKSFGIANFTLNIQFLYGMALGSSKFIYICKGSSLFMIGVTYSGYYLSNSCCCLHKIFVIFALMWFWLFPSALYTFNFYFIFKKIF